MALKFATSLRCPRWRWRLMDATNLSFLLPPSVAHKRNELEKRASHHSGQFGQQPLFPRHGGREEGRREDRCCWSRRAAVREERTTRSGLDGKDSRWVGRLFEGPQRNKRGREKRLARPRNNCDIMIQIPFDVLTRRTTHAGGGRGGRRTQQFVVRVQNT